MVQTETVSNNTTETILLVSEYHFKHRETENYKIFRIQFPYQTKKVTFNTILGKHIEIPFFMQQQRYAIIINDNGNLKMKIPCSVIYYYRNNPSYLEKDIIDVSIK